MVFCHYEHRMKRTWLRRAIGGISIVGAIFMLIAGESFLRGRLHGYGYIVYWLGCFCLTMFAVLVAFWDVKATQRHIIRDQRQFLEDTLKEIEVAARDRSRRNRNN